MTYQKASFLDQINIPSHDGIWLQENGKYEYGIGCVAFCQHSNDNSVLLIKKTPKQYKKTYEFGDMLACPGGMVRGAEGKTWGEAILSSVQDRVLKETGIILNNPVSTMVLEPGFAPITCYNTRFGSKYTLTLHLIFPECEAKPTATDDPSVQEAIWQKLPLPWSQISPANRIILARILWPKLPKAERNDVRPIVQKAWDQCSQWGENVGLELHSPPWGQ
jgi:hypothetical protein